ncbi:hypothetical protein CBG25_17870 [Arsenophonus sp. ENCA]|uniref:hypothetical protein n=1 Tax=Arsenophonus sp. ENCA TaxID=1987579 RepID=UPI000BC83784|nr:hypothetical protein [Arsenophonus sp. ENCA]PAV01235.1 hypothetical protein CBG25_17870 [Arsenophonus sp. ENCA]
MKSEMIKFFLSSCVPSGFVDSEGKVDTNVKMTDLLYLLIHLPEMGTLLDTSFAQAYKILKMA